METKLLKDYEKWEAYLAPLYEEAQTSLEFNEYLLDKAREFITLLEHSLESGLAFPDADIGHTFMFFWNNGHFYLEAEIYEDGVVEFFFKDRATEGLEWFESTTILEGFNEEIEHYLNLMARYGN